MNRPTCRSCHHWEPEISEPNRIVGESFCRNTLNNWTNSFGTRRVLAVSGDDSCQHHPDMPLFMAAFRVQRFVTAIKHLCHRIRSVR